jgi:hypothetical protein
MVALAGISILADIEEAEQARDERAPEDRRAEAGTASTCNETALTGVAGEKAQGLLVELAYAFVDWGMRAGLEHYDFAVFDALPHCIGEPRRGYDVVTTEGYLGRCINTGKLCQGVVCDHRI